MEIAFATNYLVSTGDPAIHLKYIAEAGFTHVHWGHHWNSDFLYTMPEIRAIKKMLRDHGLTLLEIHGSRGSEKRWWDSGEEYRRQAGVLLVRNRMEMFAELEGTGALMMHIPVYRCTWTDEERKASTVAADMEALYRSLDELMPYCEKYNCPIAVENFGDDTFETARDLLARYDAKWLGLTYDSGHGNINTARGLDHLDQVKDRLMALHLNDNDGSGDLHQPPFYGTVDWQRLADILDASGYDQRMLSFEVIMQKTPYMDPALPANEQTPEAIRGFMQDTYERCVKVAKMTKRFC